MQNKQPFKKISNHSMEGDNIQRLPSDTNIPSHNEMKLMDTIFKKKQSTLQKILSGTKNVLLVGILFLIFSLPIVDTLLKKFISITSKSIYILLLIKTILFMIFYFIINNLYLAKKK